MAEMNSGNRDSYKVTLLRKSVSTLVEEPWTKIYGLVQTELEL